LNSPVVWKNLNRTLSTALLWPGLSIHPTDSSIGYAGAFSGGTLKYSGSAAWSQQPACGRGGDTGIDFNQPQIVYTACSFVGASVYKSQGVAWTPAMNGIDSADAPWTLFYPPLVMDPSQSKVLYYGIARLYQTKDGANSWNPISPNWNYIYSIAVAPSNSDVVYVASYNGAFLTRNAGAGAGASWSSLTMPQMAKYFVVHPTDAQTAYTVASNLGEVKNHLYKTTSAGATWTEITSNLPDVGIWDLVIEPSTNGILYVATDIGVVWSSDPGSRATPLGPGLPRAVVTSLKRRSPTRPLRAGTYGRGAWDLALPVFIAQITAPSPGITLPGGPITFAWTTAMGADQYWLDVGNSVAHGDIWAGALAGTSQTIDGLPCDGRALYVQLWTHINGAWQSPQQYTSPATSICAVSVAQISVPAPGSTLADSSATFTWNAIGGADNYWLDVGNSVAHGDIWAGALRVTSQTVNGLPCDGRTLYLQLGTYVNGSGQ